MGQHGVVEAPPALHPTIGSSHSFCTSAIEELHYTARVVICDSRMIVDRGFASAI